MIAFLKGTMAGRSADTAFVDVNGVGFAVYMPATDIVKLPEAGADVALFTHLAVREDAMVCRALARRRRWRRFPRSSRPNLFPLFNQKT